MKYIIRHVPFIIPFPWVGIAVGFSFLLGSSTTQASWDTISIDKAGIRTEFSPDTLRKYQGMVVYLIREIEPTKGKAVTNNNFFSVTTKQMAFVCKTSRHYAIATTYHYRSAHPNMHLNDPRLGVDSIRDEDSRNWFVSISNKPTDLNVRLLRACRDSKLPRSDENIEIPLVRITEHSYEYIIAQTVRRSRDAIIEGWTKELQFKMDVPPRYQQQLNQLGIEEGPPMPLIPTIDTENGYTLRRNVVDCHDNQLAITDSIRYDKNGNVTEKYSFADDKSASNRVIPGSVGEIISTTLCSLMP